MLQTPFGKINILADGVAIPYEETPFDYSKPPVKDKPLAGCYRIHIPVKEYRSVQCVLELKQEEVTVSGSSGERYLCREFEDDATMLAIGAEDENPAFETGRVQTGMEYRVNDSIDEVVFGVAWATDYEGPSDVRVWFAADPTVCFKEERESKVTMKDTEKELEQVEKDIQNVVEKMLEKLSTVQLGELKASEAPVCEKEVYPIYFDKTEKDNSKWLELLKNALKTAKTFEIHCWNEEEERIEVALRYGRLQESDWSYGKIIVGEVTPEFADMLLTMPKPQDTELENKMTPFFNVFLDSGFQSSHYGTEVVVY